MWRLRDDGQVSVYRLAGFLSYAEVRVLETDKRYEIEIYRCGKRVVREIFEGTREAARTRARLLSQLDVTHLA